MRRITASLVFLIAFSLIMPLPNAKADDITGVVAPSPDIGSVNVGSEATLTFGADFPTNTTQSVAIVVVDYDDASFSYNGFTANMDGADVSGQFTETDDPGSLTLQCSSIVPRNGTLSLELGFEAVAKGSYTFSWRYIYIAYKEPLNIPSTLDTQGDTNARVTIPSPPPLPPPPPPQLPTPEEIENLSPEDAASLLSDLASTDAADILDEIDPKAAAEILEEMDDEDAAEILKEMDDMDAAHILGEMDENDAAKILDDIEVEDVANILEAMNETDAAGIIYAAVEENMTDTISNVLLEMEDNTTAVILLELETEVGADIVETMAHENITSAAKKVEASVKLSIHEANEEKAQEILEKMADILENVTVESLVDLFIEIANLPDTPSTVAYLFEEMNLTNVIDIVSTWISTGALEELSKVFDYLNPTTLGNVYLDISADERTTILPYLSEGTAASLPSLAKFDVTALSILPTQIFAGEATTISVKISNIGEGSGNYNVTLIVDRMTEQTAAIALDVNSSTMIFFSVVKNVTGDYSVEVDGLTGSFTVSKPPTPAKFEVSDLEVHPTEVEPKESVTVTVTLSNVGEEPGSYNVELTVDDTVVNSETVTLNGGASEPISFNISSTDEGSHTVEVNELTGSFTVSRVHKGIQNQILIILTVTVIAVLSVLYFHARSMTRE